MFYLFNEKNLQFTRSKFYENLFILRFIYFTEKKCSLRTRKFYESLLILQFIYFTIQICSLRERKFYEILLILRLFILPKKSAVYENVNFTKFYLFYVYLFYDFTCCIDWYTDHVFYVFF